MVKSEIIASIAKKFKQLPGKDIEWGVNQILECISEALAQGEHVEIRGFGSFTVQFRPPRKAHNPKTGAKVLTKPTYVLHFKPGKELRKIINDARKTVKIKV